MTTIGIIIGVMVALLLVAVVKRERIQIYEDGIKIKDLLFPLSIPNDTIVSISLVDSLPEITNGMGMGLGMKGYFMGSLPIFDYITMWGLILKGYFRVKNSSQEHSENATLYIRNGWNDSAIEIRTVKGLVYINKKNDELTQSLFNEMKNTVKILENSELNLDAKRPRTYRSVIVTAVFFVVLLTQTLFIYNAINEIVVGNDVIEIKGEHAMTIPVSEIDTVLLIEELPSIKTRANGISTRKVNIGKFKMSDGEKANLYINKNVDMFIEIKLNAHGSQHKADLIFINRKTVEETKALYEEIFNSKY